MSDTASRDAFPLPAVIGILIAHLVVLFLTLVEVVKIVPLYSLMFEEYDLKLPVITEQLISISNYVLKYWYAVTLIVLLVDGAIICLLARLPRSARWIMSAYSHTVLIASVLLFFYISICWAPVVMSLEALKEQGSIRIEEDLEQ